MAIAFDAASKVNTGSNWYDPGSTVTWAHTCSSGSDRILIVSLSTGSKGDWVSGVTYAGSAMTLLGKVPRQDSSTQYFYIYYIVNPASGSNNITVTMTDATEIYLLGFAASYTGVAQNAPEAYSISSSAPGGSSITKSITTLTDNAWLVGSINAMSGGTITPAAGTTYRNSFTWSGICDSNGAKSPAGGYSLGATDGTNGYWFGAVMSLAPAGATPPATNYGLLSYI